MFALALAVTFNVECVSVASVVTKVSLNRKLRATLLLICCDWFTIKSNWFSKDSASSWELFCKSVSCLNGTSLIKRTFFVPEGGVLPEVNVIVAVEPVKLTVYCVVIVFNTVIG